MNILLADDHPMVRVGLKLMLARLFEDAIISEAKDYAGAIEICTENSGLDLILLDKMMPGQNNLNALTIIIELQPDTPIVVLSASEEPEDVWECLKHGARGYIPKTMNEDVMNNALQLVLSGGTYIPDALLSTAGQGIPAISAVDKSKQNTSSCVNGGEIGLTKRQSEILSIMRLGRSNKQIADMLNISTATVQSHVNAIFKALEVNNRTQAVHVATIAGLFSPI
jgi:DNA-binding NarL/FixJ family response regulator